MSKNKRKYALDINSTEIDNWIKFDIRDRKSKAMLMYYHGYEENEICMRLFLKKAKLMSWIEETYNFKRPKNNVSNKKRVQDGKSKWVNKIVKNHIKNNKNIVNVKG
jgi:hypothetical protein